MPFLFACAGSSCESWAVSGKPAVALGRKLGRCWLLQGLGELAVQGRALARGEWGASRREKERRGRRGQEWSWRLGEGSTDSLVSTFR